MNACECRYSHATGKRTMQGERGALERAPGDGGIGGWMGKTNYVWKCHTKSNTMLIFKS